MSTFSKSATQSLALTQSGAGPKIVKRSATHTLNLVQTQARGLVITSGITITEKIESRRLEHTSKGRELTRIFTIQGTDDPVQADPLGPQIGDTYDDSIGNDEGSGFTDLSLFVGRRDLIPLLVGSGGPKAIRLEVTYFEVNRNPSGVSRRVSLDIAGQSLLIGRAISQRSFPTSKNLEISKKWGRAIGPITRNELKGANILQAMVTLSEVHERNRLSEAYIQTVLDVHGMVNRFIFRGFAVGIVLFQGARASTTPDGRWMLEYIFKIAPKEVTRLIDEFVDDDGIPMGPETVTVEGHEHLWYNWVKQDGGAGKEQYKLKSIHIATIFKSADFAALEIGTEPLT